jgi:hypothetical protein
MPFIFLLVVDRDAKFQLNMKPGGATKKTLCVSASLRLCAKKVGVC